MGRGDAPPLHGHRIMLSDEIQQNKPMQHDPGLMASMGHVSLDLGGLAVVVMVRSAVFSFALLVNLLQAWS